MLVVLSAKVMLVDLSVAIMQLDVSAASLQIKVFAANMWVTIFIEIMQSLLPLCRWYFLQCIMYMIISIVTIHVTISVAAMYVTVSSANFTFLSLTPAFQKIDKKTFKGIISSLHFTTFVNILPKLRYFVGRSHI